MPQFVQKGARSSAAGGAHVLSSAGGDALQNTLPSTNWKSCPDT